MELNKYIDHTVLKQQLIKKILENYAKKQENIIFIAYVLMDVM